MKDQTATPLIRINPPVFFTSAAVIFAFVVFGAVGYTKEKIIGDVLSQYEKHVHYLHLTR